MVSTSWKGLSPEDRKDWDEAADQDKKRYEQEKSTYKGPWKIPTNKRKTKEWVIGNRNVFLRATTAWSGPLNCTVQLTSFLLFSLYLQLFIKSLGTKAPYERFPCLLQQ